MGWNLSKKLAGAIELPTPAALSTDAMGVVAGFGLVPTKSTHRGDKATDPGAHLLDEIRRSRSVLITGASGSGKSCLLRGIERALKTSRSTGVHIVDALDLEHTPAAMIDLLDGQIMDRATTLAHAGLAEPKLWAMPPAMLSVGERARLAMAVTMHRARPGEAVLADEFATPLDRISAQSVAKTMRRWASRNQITLIAATAHADMESMLCPDLVIDMDTPAPSTRQPMARVEPKIRIEAGTMDDYALLAHLHYRSGKPATHTRVLRAMRSLNDQGEMLAGVLVVSMPTLNGAWRDRPWPRFFSGGDKADNATAINTHLRCISRVVVESRSRGLGIASGLVRAYLDHPDTVATEAIAAMGSVCPFFERAGMVSYELLPAKPELRLFDALDAAGVSITDLIRSEIEPGSLVERELIIWSKARKLIGAGRPDHQITVQLAPIAACRLLARPRAYAHVHKGGHDGTRERPNHTDAGAAED